MQLLSHGTYDKTQTTPVMPQKYPGKFHETMGKKMSLWVHTDFIFTLDLIYFQTEDE